jgi:nucleotide-binding universal stress UspA family protein
LIVDPFLERNMDYKTVMVSLALDRSNEACLAVAGDVAERFGSRVVGIAASDLRPALYFAEGGYAEKVIDQEEHSIQKRLSELESEFRSALQPRAKTVEWRSALTLSSTYIAQQARTADLLVVGARSEAMVDPCVSADPNDLLMQAGRPLVIVPQSVKWLDLRSVLVAWKDVRETRRAVLDTLPLLAAAKEITIAEIPEKGTDRADALSHVDDVAAWLSSHGISASTAVPDAKTDIIGQLDEIAANVGAGAVIAGAYGHSRLREWVMGGVTRHLVTESSRCAFLSR